MGISKDFPIKEGESWNNFCCHILILKEYNKYEEH